MPVFDNSGVPNSKRFGKGQLCRDVAIQNAVRFIEPFGQKRGHRSLGDTGIATKKADFLHRCAQNQGHLRVIPVHLRTHAAIDVLHTGIRELAFRRRIEVAVRASVFRQAQVWILKTDSRAGTKLSNRQLRNLRYDGPIQSCHGARLRQTKLPKPRLTILVILSGDNAFIRPIAPVDHGHGTALGALHLCCRIRKRRPCRIVSLPCHAREAL